MELWITQNIWISWCRQEQQRANSNVQAWAHPHSVHWLHGHTGSEWGKYTNIHYPKEEETEKAMAPHSSTLAWKIPWTEEPGGLQSMGSRRVGHNWMTSLSLFTFMHWRRKWQPTPVFLPGESQGRGSLVGCRLWGRTVGHNWSDLAAAAESPEIINALTTQTRLSNWTELNLWQRR